MPQLARPVDWLKVEAQRGKYLRAYHRALMNRANAPVDILCVGDSETEGYKATVFGVGGTRYPDVLRETVRDRWQPAGIEGGEGYVPIDQTAPVVDRFTGTYTANTAQWGLGRRARTLNGAGLSLSIDVQCTGIDIFWASGTGTFSWAIDGGAATNVSTVIGHTEGGQVTQIRGLSSGVHTLTISRVSGLSTIEGIMVYDGDEDLGVRVWEGGHSSYQSSDFASGDLSLGGGWAHPIATIQPALVLIGLGVNDYFFGGSSADLKTNLAAIVALVRAQCTIHPSIVFIVQPKRDDSFVPLEPYTAYVNAVYAAARADGEIGVINLHERFWTGNEAPYASGVGLLDVDRIHPSDLGYAFWARAVAGYLEP